MTVGSADRQKPTQKLDELLAQKTHKVNSLVRDTHRLITRLIISLCTSNGNKGGYYLRPLNRLPYKKNMPFC